MHLAIIGQLRLLVSRIFDMTKDLVCFARLVAELTPQMAMEFEASIGFHIDCDHVHDFNARQFQKVPVSEKADFELNFNRLQKRKST